MQIYRKIVKQSKIYLNKYGSKILLMQGTYSTSDETSLMKQILSKFEIPFSFISKYKS